MDACSLFKYGFYSCAWKPQLAHAIKVNFLVLLTGTPCKINISLHVLSMVPIKEIDMVSLSSTFNQDTETMSLFCLSR